MEDRLIDLGDRAGALVRTAARIAMNGLTFVGKEVAETVFPVDPDATGVDGVVAFPRSRQRDGYSCGSRSVYAVIRHFGRAGDHASVAAALGTTEEGTAATPMIAYLRRRGLRAGRHPRLRLAGLRRAFAAGKVAIVDFGGVHWAVAHAMDDDHVWVADPSAYGTPGTRMTRAEFRRRWTGMCILVGPRRRRRR
jgi:ABC-type bacteriocin/lantibiotic exporter with double-glycine peptidase domain